MRHVVFLSLFLVVPFLVGCAEPTPGSGTSTVAQNQGDGGLTPPSTTAQSDPTAANSQPAPATQGNSQTTPANPAAYGPGPGSVPPANTGTPSTDTGYPGYPPPGTGNANPANANPGPAPGNERVKADVGVGAKGRSLDKYEGATERVIVQPARSLFAAQERLTFGVSIPQAMNLYRASNGNFPRSHDEFMREIIQANNIRLPDLRQGERYVYDPQKAELMVERPVR